MEVLKLCPFCGDSANLEHWGSEVSILCSNCNVRSAPFFAENEAQAIAAWNARAEAKELPLETVERLRGALVAARPVVMAMTGTEWAGIGSFKSWQEADDSLRAIKSKIDAALARTSLGTDGHD